MLCHLTSHMLYYCYLLPLVIRSIFKMSIICSHLVEPILLNSVKDCFPGRFPGGSVGKNLPANTGDIGSIPALGRSPGKGNGNPLQYSCLKSPMDRGAWQVTVHRVTKSQTWLKRLSKHACMMQSDILHFIYSILLYSFYWSKVDLQYHVVANVQHIQFYTHTNIYVCITHTHVLFQVLFLIGYYKIRVWFCATL